MLKLLTIPLLTLCVFLASCQHDQLSYAQASYLCKDHGGIFKLHPLTGAVCKNGTRFSNREVFETIIPVEHISKYYNEQANH